MDVHANYSRNLHLLLCLCLAVSGLAQIRNMMPETADSGMGGTNAIEGRVFVQTGQRLERRVAVRLSTMTKGDVVAMTDDSGNFAFRGLVSGTYTITIDKEKDFEPFSQQVQIIQLRGSPPQVFPLNVRLTPKPGIEFKTGVVNSDLAGVPEKALTFYKKALELAGTGDHKGAIGQLLLAVQEHPQFMTAFTELGVQYMQTNELQKADEALQSALRIEPEAFTPLANRGIVLVLLKRFGEAETSLRSALKTNDRSAIGHYYLGRAVAYQGRFDEAEKEFADCIRLGGDEMKEAHRYLAILYSVRGDKKRAAAELETYLRLVPTASDSEQLRNTIRQLKGLETQNSSSPNAKPSN
jgi:tetratricopeptide (TPR) repeat protein